MTTLELKNNISVILSTADNALFTASFLSIDKGRHPANNEEINLYNRNVCFLINNLHELIINVYPDKISISISFTLVQRDNKY